MLRPLTKIPRTLCHTRPPVLTWLCDPGPALSVFTLGLVVDVMIVMTTAGPIPAILLGAAA